MSVDCSLSRIFPKNVQNCPKTVLSRECSQPAGFSILPQCGFLSPPPYPYDPPSALHRQSPHLAISDDFSHIQMLQKPKWSTQ